MIDPRELSGDDLQALARQWRREALRGDREARGRAYLYEAELRRRVGSPVQVSHSLDTRPLSLRARPRSWWRFWEKPLIQSGHPNSAQ